MKATLEFDLWSEMSKFEAALRSDRMGSAVKDLDAVMKAKIDAAGTPASVKTVLTAVREELRTKLKKYEIYKLLEDLS